MREKLLVLVDGSYYLFRAYHAMGRLTNAAGEHTGAIYGVINMLRKLIKDEQPDYFAVIFDAKGKSFRHDLYPKYKANRPPIPEELACQIKPLHEIIHALGVPLLLIDNVEADDVIATLARQADDAGMKTLISTGDKDLAQVVNDNIHLINTMSNTLFDRDGVIEKYGVPPERIVDYLALIGDTSDNVPGIPKVGPKTAVKWLMEHGDLNTIVANADSVKGKVGEHLRNNLAQIPLSKELVTLKLDVALEMGPRQLLIGEQDKDKLKAHYQKWGFRSWLPEINGGKTGRDDEAPSHTADTAETNGAYESIYTFKQLNRWISKLSKADLFSLDTETTSLDYMQAELVGLSFSVSAGEAAYVPVAHDYTGAPRQLSRRAVLERLRPLLESDVANIVGQNVKYDKHILANYNIDLNGIAHDSMLQSYVLDSIASRHDMDSLAEKHLGRATIHYEDIAGKGAKQLTFNQIAIEDAAPYAAEDADVTLQLHRALWPKLQKQTGLKALYEEIEIPLLAVLCGMERNGVIIDADRLLRQSETLAGRMHEVELQSHKVAGGPFNIGSPKQIQQILYEKMGLPVLARTGKGQPSTAESVLQELAVDYELPRLILEHRGLSKLKSTYTDKLPQQMNPSTGRIHSSYHQAVAATGRLSCSDPNLQNIPIRTEEGRKVRQAFIPPPGYVLMAADYSQIELRIMAHLSADATLLRAFRDGEDIHRATAAEVFAVEIANVTKAQRRAAKAINFGLIYGMSAFGLAKQLGIGRGEAKQYVDSYFERYPAVRDYMASTREGARERGYVETVFGRRLYLPEIHSRNAPTRQYAERTAINAPMQGTAADIIKRAMIDIDKHLLRANKDINLIMQVHDELVFEVAEGRIDNYKKEIARCMSTAAALRVPLVVDIGTGGNWDEAH